MMPCLPAPHAWRLAIRLRRSWARCLERLLWSAHDGAAANAATGRAGSARPGLAAVMDAGEDSGNCGVEHAHGCLSDAGGAQGHRLHADSHRPESCRSVLLAAADCRWEIGRAHGSTPDTVPT